MNKANSLTDFVSMRTLERIQDNFSDATGIGCVMRNLKGEPVTKFSKPSRLWMEIVKHPEFEKELEPVLLEGLDKCFKTGQIQVVTRYMDTHAFIVPMGIDGRILGFLVGGLVRYGNPNIVNCAKEADRLGIDLDEYLEMYLELQLVTQERLEASANLFKIVASSISSLAKEGSEAKAKVDEMASLNNMLEKEVEIASIELKESEERYRRIFNTINDGVYETDMQGIIKDINPAGARMLGYSRGELIGRNMRDLYINPADRDEFVTMVMTKHHVERFHPRVRLKEGKIGHFETNAVLIIDQNGKTTGIQGIFRDVTPRRHSNIKKKDNVPAKTDIPSNKD
jgi:PAS domain S-box-containing protein